MKIFLTGDNHLGLKYASHPQAKILAESRISAFENFEGRFALRRGCLCGDAVFFSAQHR